MIVHFFTFSGPSGGSSRQRAFRVVEEINTRGIKAVIHHPPALSLSTTPWPGKFILIVQTIRSLFSIKKGDIIYLQRTVVNKYFFVIMVAYLFLFRRKMILDIDDPVYLYNFFKTKTFAQMADAVVTCTHGQAEWAKEYNSNVHIIHISLEFPVYEKFMKDYSSTNAPCIIGWVGNGPEHVKNLEILASVFRKLLVTDHPDFKFVLIGALGDKSVYDVFQNIDGLNVEFIDSLEWTDPESVPREIQKFDIGVLPHQSEGEWNKSKTTLKVLQYMACEVASISSAFGEISYMIEDGVNGYIAHSEEEWVQKLQKLLSDMELRERFGHAGRELVRQQYSYEAIIPHIIKILKDVENKA